MDQASRPSDPSFTPNGGLDRRQLLQRSLFGCLGVSLFGGPVALAAGSSAATPVGSGADSIGPLLPPNAQGLQLPPGFSSRIVAISNQVVAGTNHVWHRDPDGGATFATPDGGWIYVSNAERSNGQGGVGAIRFLGDGNIVAAYTILSGTSRNCAGGPTPWGTWLSAEEVGAGRVYECDPYTPGSQGVVRPALGVFNHEAAAVDPFEQVVYLTEDRSDGLLYRMRPTSYPDLSAGTMEAARIMGPGLIQPGQTRAVEWLPVPDPTTALTGTPTRYQVPGATTFRRGEGCWFENGLLYFATTTDNRVWCLGAAGTSISIVYDLATTSKPILSGADNVFVTPRGDVYVSEDGGNLEIVALTQSGDVKPIVRQVGVSGTEITGPALSPDGTRLYFSSQRNPGITFEVQGPFLGTPRVDPVPAMAGLGAALTAMAVAGLGALALRREQLGGEQGNDI
jgi:uncharacterized protein